MRHQPKKHFFIYFFYLDKIFQYSSYLLNFKLKKIIIDQFKRSLRRTKIIIAYDCERKELIIGDVVAYFFPFYNNEIDYYEILDNYCLKYVGHVGCLNPKRYYHGDDIRERC